MSQSALKMNSIYTLKYLEQHDVEQHHADGRDVRERVRRDGRARDVRAGRWRLCRRAGGLHGDVRGAVCGARRPGRPGLREPRVRCGAVVRGGAVLDADSDENSVRGVREMIAYAQTLKGVEMTALQTVGEKGYDGMAIFRVL